ncbi:hypothetical protein PA598K_06478 [Paenibacillus sp. 598K]|nr:hypothetical protein PA598K_06478 [Paenibacillus sp. 598K]
MLLSGCEGAAVEPTNEVVSATAIEAERVATTNSVASITTATIAELLDKSTTKEDVRAAFGQPSYIGKSVYWVGDDLVHTEIWRYDQAPQGYSYEWGDNQGAIDLDGLISRKLNAQLLLYWSEEGKLLDAIYYYRDSNGKLQTLLPALRLSQSSSSTDNRIAREEGLRIGSSVRVQNGFDTTRLPEGADNAVAFRAVPGRTYRLAALTEHFAQLIEVREGEGWYDGWVPVWTLTDEAAPIKEQAAERWRADKAGASIYWQPTDDAEARSLEPGERLLVVGASGDWRAVIVEEAAQAALPRIVWVKDEGDALVSESKLQGLFDSAEAAYPLVRAVVYHYVREGVAKAKLAHLLGKPQAVERSGNVRSTGEPMETLTRWRYESDSAELLIDWSSEDKVASFRLSPREEGQPYTAEQPLLWQADSDLAYNFFIGRTDRALLISGEDGGFSGMHYDSNVYALDPETGRKLWQRDLGYENDRYMFSPDRRVMAVHIPTGAADEGQRHERLEVLDTSSGKSLWTLDRELADDTIDVSYQLAGDTIAMLYTTGEFDHPSTHRSFIEAYALRDGGKRWTRELEQVGSLVPTLVATDQLLIQYSGLTGVSIGREVVAYDPSTGEESWRKEGQAAQLLGWVENFNFEARALDNKPNRLWMMDAAEWTWIDMSTGQSLARLSRGPDKGYEIVDDRYAVQLTTKDGSELAYGGEVTSAWIELASGQTKWTAPGRLDSAIVVDDAVYARVDGKLQRLRLSDGQRQWESKLNYGGRLQWFDGHLLSAVPSGIVVIDPQSGEALYRMAGTGSGAYDAIAHWQMRAQLTALDGKLYIGSDNGLFSVADRLAKLPAAPANR